MKYLIEVEVEEEFDWTQNCLQEYIEEEEGLTVNWIRVQND